MADKVNIKTEQRITDLKGLTAFIQELANMNHRKQQNVIVLSCLFSAQPARVNSYNCHPALFFTRESGDKASGYLDSRDEQTEVPDSNGMLVSGVLSPW